MYLGCSTRSEALKTRSELFGGLDATLQQKLLTTALRNDARANGDSSLATAISSIDASSLLERCTEEIQRLAGSSVPVADLSAAVHAATSDEQFWAAVEEGAGRVLTGVRAASARASALSLFFAVCGHLPVSSYAFGCWRLPPGRPDQEALAALMELAVAYYYRLVPWTSPCFAPVVAAGEIVGAGAYSTVVRHGDIAVKVAQNLAAKHFLMRQESLLLQALEETPARHYLPAHVAYDDEGKVLRREYVDGPSGHTLLETGIFRHSSRQRRELKATYNAFVTGLRQVGATLDLHPQNFVWDEASLRWVLVDVGPVPAIGFEYYDLASFENYECDVWLRRIERMRTEPIRSLAWM